MTYAKRIYVILLVILYNLQTASLGAVVEEEVPRHVWIHILENLHLQGLLSFRSVSKRFKDIVNNPELWKPYTLVARKGVGDIVCFFRDSRDDPRNGTRMLSLEKLVPFTLPVRALEACLIGREVIEVIKKVNIKELTSFELTQNVLGSAEAEVLVNRLGEAKGLRWLHLYEVTLGSVGAQALVNCLGNLKELRYINLGSNGIDFTKVEGLAESLGELKKLETLRPGCSNKLGVVGAQALASCLGKLKRLKELNLANTGLRDQGALVLVEGLRELNELKALYLYINEISPEVQAIFKQQIPERVTMIF